MKPKLPAFFLITYFVVLWIVLLSDLSRFIADDSYFYMTTARNLVLAGRQTFNGITLTNGVHPLWLYFLSLTYLPVAWISPAWLYQPVSVVPAAMLALSLGAYFSWKVAGLLKIDPLLFTSIPLGFLAAMNMIGSEAFLLYACLAFCTYLVLCAERPTILQRVWVGLSAAAVFLARLDMVFFVAAFLLWILWMRGYFRLWAVTLAAAVVPSILYVLSNLYFFGQAVPVSGWLKSSFPMVNLRGLMIYRLSSEWSGYNLFFGVAPILFACLILPFLHGWLGPKRSIVYTFWIGAVGHWLYTSVFTRGATGWLWYYLLPVMLGALTLALLLARIKVFSTGSSTVTYTVLLLAACFFLSYPLRTLLRPSIPSQTEVMLDYLQKNRISDATILVGDSPGGVAFYSTNRVIALDMLTTSPDYVNGLVTSTNGLEYIFKQATNSGYPINYILYTSGTWLGDFEISPDRSQVVFYFLVPGGLSYKSLGAARLGQKIFEAKDLIVWQAPKYASSRP